MRRHAICQGDRKMHTFRRGFLAGLLLVLGPAGLFPALGGDMESARGRWAGPSRLVAERAEWVTFDGGKGVLGSSTSVTVLAGWDQTTPTRRVALLRPVTHGVLAARDLYLVERAGEGDRLIRLNIDAKIAQPHSLELVPAPKDELLLARMDDYLLVMENGHGLRFLRLPHPTYGGHGGHHQGAPPVQEAFLPLPFRAHAVASSLRQVYLATDGAIVVVSAGVPGAAAVDRTIPTEGAKIHALAANGPTLYAMTERGLSAFDLKDDGSIRKREHPDVRGGGIYMAGRSLYVAGGEDGLISFEDVSPALATIFIQVGDLFFNPSGLVNVGLGKPVYRVAHDDDFPRRLVQSARSAPGWMVIADPVFASVFRRFLVHLTVPAEVVERVDIVLDNDARTAFRRSNGDRWVWVSPLVERRVVPMVPPHLHRIPGRWSIAASSFERLRARLSFDVAVGSSD